MPRARQDDLPVQGERDPLARLLKRADAFTGEAERLIRRSVRDIRAELALAVREKPVGTSAAARESVIADAQKRILRLRKRLASLERAEQEYATRAAFDGGLLAAGLSARQADKLDVHYSKKRADDIIAMVAGDTAKSFSAVFTENMARNVTEALRSATVAAFREQAVAGGTSRELADDLERRWLDAAKDGETFEFVDAGGRVWDTRTYIETNVRTNSMRLYNDALIQTIGEATGSDLVRVSVGGDPNCRLCFPWEGRILSITGNTKGFPTYDEARAAGLFHPNCVHTLEAVDETVDADEIALQHAHPLGGDDITPDEADENRYEIDTARKVADGMTRDEARLAVDRDNLRDNLRAGLVRADADEVVASLTDGQVAALVKNGNPPAFAPAKDNDGEEGWNRGRRGGVVYVGRGELSAERLLRIAGVE